MDEEEYNAFLLQKADEVDDLVQDDNVKKVFQDHTRAAFAQNHLFGKHLEALRCSNPDPALPQLCDDEKLTLEYFLLTLIHDFAPGDVPTTRFIYFDFSKCNKDEYFWADVEYRLWTSSYTEDHEAGGKIRHNISRALEHIKTIHKPATSGGKADLPNEKPIETEQNISKFAKIIGSLKHMIEKGWQIFTKSFWEALFDRVWPK